MGVPNRFDYVKYDSAAAVLQTAFKEKFQELETMISKVMPGRSAALVLTALEEAYMWVGKALRDEQVVQRSAEFQEGRGNE